MPKKRRPAEVQVIYAEVAFTADIGDEDCDISSYMLTGGMQPLLNYAVPVEKTNLHRGVRLPRDPDQLDTLARAIKRLAKKFRDGEDGRSVIRG